MKYEPNLDEVTRSLASLNVHYINMGNQLITIDNRKKGRKVVFTRGAKGQQTKQRILIDKGGSDSVYSFFDVSGFNASFGCQ
jgi:hypothetical protein